MSLAKVPSADLHAHESALENEFCMSDTRFREGGGRRDDEGWRKDFPLPIHCSLQGLCHIFTSLILQGTPFKALSRPTMDPLSTFSLVCGIIQIIDFSSKAVKKCREIVKDGALAENTEIEELAKHLLNLPGELHLTDHGDMDDIVKLGTDCSNTARELVAELEALKVDEPPRKREILWKTIMTYKKREPIHNIEKRLWEYRKLLDHKILVDLRFVSPFLFLCLPTMCNWPNKLCKYSSHPKKKKGATGIIVAKQCHLAID